MAAQREENSRRKKILSTKEKKQSALLAKARNLSKIRAQRGEELRAKLTAKASLEMRMKKERTTQHEDTVLAMASDVQRVMRAQKEKQREDKAEIQRVLAKQKQWVKMAKMGEQLKWK